MPCVEDLAYVEAGFERLEAEAQLPASSRQVLSNVGAHLFLHGRWLLCDILHTRRIPQAKIKAFMGARRLFMSMRRRPSKPLSWAKRHRAKVRLLIDAAKTWPPKQEGSDELFSVGNLKVHNVLGLVGTELEVFKGDVAKVQTLARWSGVPGFAKVLYGAIYLMPALNKEWIAGSYNQDRDEIYTRHSRDCPMSEVKTLLHELGHRFWKKFAETQKKEAWIKYYEDTLAFSQRIVLPKVGDLVKRKTGVQPIVKIKDGEAYFKHPDPITVKVEEIVTKWRSTAKQNAFCTPYASTNPEECFCETIAFFCLGELTPEQENAFREIWF